MRRLSSKYCYHTDCQDRGEGGRVTAVAMPGLGLAPWRQGLFLSRSWRFSVLDSTCAYSIYPIATNQNPGVQSESLNIDISTGQCDWLCCRNVSVAPPKEGGTARARIADLSYQVGPSALVCPLSALLSPVSKWMHAIHSAKMKWAWRGRCCLVSAPHASSSSATLDPRLCGLLTIR
jgi:hypothetical protein